MERYLASQTRVTGSAKDEIAKLSPRLKEAQQKLDDSQAVMRERSEKAVVETLLAESEKRVADAEAHVQKATEAEAHPSYLSSSQRPQTAIGPTWANRGNVVDLIKFDNFFRFSTRIELGASK